MPRLQISSAKTAWFIRAASSETPEFSHESTATFQASNKKGAPFVTDLQCLVAFKILSQMSQDFLDPKCPFEMKVIYQL